MNIKQYRELRIEFGKDSSLPEPQNQTANIFIQRILKETYMKYIGSLESNDFKNDYNKEIDDILKYVTEKLGLIKFDMPTTPEIVTEQSVTQSEVNTPVEPTQESNVETPQTVTEPTIENSQPTE